MTTLRMFDIAMPLPSGNTATFTFFAADENDPDLNFVFDALYGHARYHHSPEPKLVERVTKPIR